MPAAWATARCHPACALLDQQPRGRVENPDRIASAPCIEDNRDCFRWISLITSLAYQRKQPWEHHDHRHGSHRPLGSQIVARLLERVPAGTVGVSVRDVGKAAALAERGVRVRAGDFTEPATLRHAFEGADQVLVVSAAIRGAGAVAANLAAIDAARAAGAQRILYTSHQAASKDSLFAPQTRTR